MRVWYVLVALATSVAFAQTPAKRFAVMTDEAGVIVAPTNLDAVASGLAPVSAIPTPRPFPVFHIPLDGVFTDFALKASTNNFASDAGTVYYYRSWNDDYVPGTNNVYGWPQPTDPECRVYYTEYATIESPRNNLKWRRKPYGVSIFDALHDVASVVPAAVVYPSTNVRNVASAPWMWEGNPEVVWVYIRRDASKLEGLPSDSWNWFLARKWRAITPVSWVAERPDIADPGWEN